MSSRARPTRQKPYPPQPDSPLAKESAEMLAQVQARADQARQAAIVAQKAAMEAEQKAQEAERVILDQQQKMKEEAVRKQEQTRKAEEARKKEEEMRKAEETRKAEEARKKAVAKKKEIAQKNQPQAREEDEEEEDANTIRVTGHTRRHVVLSEEEQPVTKSKTKKKVSKTPAMINDSGKDISDDIVQGALYPSCVACSNANKPCHWKMSIIHLRLRGLPNKARNCENCVRAKGPCQLIWDCDSDESLKRAADSALEPESSKRVKVDCPDLVTCLQSIDEKIGALVNLTAAQALRTTKEHEAK